MQQAPAAVDPVSLTESVDEIVRISNQFGQQVILALILLVVVLFMSKYLGNLLAKGLVRLGVPERRALFPVTGLHVVVILVGALIVLNLMGFPGEVLFRVLLAVAMAAMALYIIAGPYLPKLPLTTGDVIMLGSVFGQVEKITFLHTMLHSFDGKTIFIPNQVILASQVTNLSLKPNRRADVELYIPYGEDLEEVKRVVGEVLSTDERVLEDPAPTVAINKFSPSYREMLARYWMSSQGFLASRWEINEKIDVALRQAGIEMAAPRLEVVQGGETVASPE
jgi:small conductance mechanosensitive channel